MAAGSHITTGSINATGAVANGGINLLSIAGNIDTTGIIPAAPALETAPYGSPKTSLAALNGGLVSLEAAGNIKIGNINSRSANDNGGYISLLGSGTIDTTLGNLSARSNSDGVEKGNISLAARGNIAINRLVSGTADGNAGSLTLFSKEGEIVLNSDYDLSAVITNGSVRLGVFGKGNLGGSKVGIDLAGLGDAIMPGCLCEGWGVAGNGIAGGASAANDAPGNLKLTAFASTPSTATSTVTLSTLPSLQISQAYLPALEAPTSLFEDRVTITNKSSDSISDIRYTRAMDWDVPPHPFNEYVTISGREGAKNVIYSSNNGFATVNPLEPKEHVEYYPDKSKIDKGLQTINSDFTDIGPTDHGAVFDLGFGNLAGNSAKTFSIYYGATTSEATAMSALTHVNAEMYSLGQSAPDGTPGTFIFGFKGVGGQPLEVKAPPIVPLTPVPEIQDDKPPFPDGKVPSKDRDSSTPVITDGSSPSASDGRGGSAAGDLSSSPSSPSASDGRGGSADDLSSSTSDGKTYDLSISTTFNPTPSQTARNIAVNNVIDAFNQANENVGQLTQGFIYQTLVNNTAIFQPLTDVNNPDGAKIRKNLEELANGRSTLFQFGRGAGDLVGLAQGLLEIGGGGGTTSGGAVLTSTGFGTVPGGLVMAAGVAQVLHGASVGGASAQDLGKLISYVFASSGSGGSSVNPGGQGASGQSTESFYDAETRRLAREHKILYDEASALKEVLESPATKPDGLLVVGEDKVAKFFGVDRNDFKLPEFIAQRKDGKFIAAEVKNQNEADIASALGKFEDVVKLVKNLKGKYQGMGEHRMGQFLIFVRKGFSGFNDRTFSVGQNGLLLQNGEIYRVDGIPVQVKARDLVPQSQTGGR